MHARALAGGAGGVPGRGVHRPLRGRPGDRDRGPSRDRRDRGGRASTAATAPVRRDRRDPRIRPGRRAGRAAARRRGPVDWEPHLAFPGLTPDERSTASTRVGERGAAPGADGTPAGRGAGRSPHARRSGLSALAIAGAVGSPSRKQARRALRAGLPPEHASPGTSGLELAFNAELAGQPSGQLLAVRRRRRRGEPRILASGDPVPGKPVKTTIDPDVQTAAVTALGEHLRRRRRARRA